MKNSTFFSRLLLVALFCGGSHFLQAQSVIPVPLQMEQTEGAFDFWWPLSVLPMSRPEN